MRGNDTTKREDGILKGYNPVIKKEKKNGKLRRKKDKIPLWSITKRSLKVRIFKGAAMKHTTGDKLSLPIKENEKNRLSLKKQPSTAIDLVRISPQLLLLEHVAHSMYMQYCNW